MEAERPRIYDEIFVVWECGAGLIRWDTYPELAVPTLKTLNKERYGPQ